MADEDLELPESYIIGEEYFNDLEKRFVDFNVFFHSPAIVQAVELDTVSGKVKIDQRGSSVRVKFARELSLKLVTDWFRDEPKAHRWIIGYQAEVLPFVNQELLRQRYELGHFFVKTYSIFDITQIGIVDLVTEEILRVKPPGPIPEFPPIAAAKKEHSSLPYIKDLIDAGHSYFVFNYEDCIRRVITSLDTFFQHHDFVKLDKYFKDRVVRSFNFVYEPYAINVASELNRTYGIRNQIVHQGKRYPVGEQRKFAEQALCFLFIAYRLFGNDEELKQFVFDLEKQFKLQMDMIGHGVSLKELEAFSNL